MIKIYRIPTRELFNKLISQIPIELQPTKGVWGFYQNNTCVRVNFSGKKVIDFGFSYVEVYIQKYPDIPIIEYKGDSIFDVDVVNHPPHYKSDSGIESIDVIEEFGLNFHLGNVIKYILRHQKKGKPLEDLKKARWYLDREIEKLESKEG